MKVRLINSLEGLGSGLADPRYHRAPPYLGALGQLTTQQFTQADQLIADHGVLLGQVEIVLLAAVQENRISRSTYELLLSERNEFNESIVGMSNRFDMEVNTADEYQSWVAAAQRLVAEIRTFISKVERDIGAELSKRPTRFLWLTVASVVLLGGAAAIIVARTTKKKARRRSRRRSTRRSRR